jgi:hypothetical protein
MQWNQLISSIWITKSTQALVKALTKNGDETKLGTKILLMQWGDQEQNAPKEFASNIFSRIASQFVPLLLPKSLDLYCMKMHTKGKH